MKADFTEIRGYSDEYFDAVAAAERLCFSDPWSEDMLRDSFKGERCCAFLAFCENRLAGYIILLDAVDMTEILNVAVLPEMRRRGIAKALLEKAESIAREKGHDALCLEVRASNTPAKELYTSFGFIPAAVRKNYYSSPKEDAVIMLKDITNSV